MFILQGSGLLGSGPTGLGLVIPLCRLRSAIGLLCFIALKGALVLPGVLHIEG